MVIVIRIKIQAARTQLFPAPGAVVIALWGFVLLNPWINPIELVPLLPHFTDEEIRACLVHHLPSSSHSGCQSWLCDSPEYPISGHQRVWSGRAREGSDLREAQMLEEVRGLTVREWLLVLRT